MSLLFPLWMFKNHLWIQTLHLVPFLLAVQCRCSLNHFEDNKKLCNWFDSVALYIINIYIYYFIFLFLLVLFFYLNFFTPKSIIMSQLWHLKQNTLKQNLKTGILKIQRQKHWRRLCWIITIMKIKCVVQVIVLIRVLAVNKIVHFS